jgi:predicted lipoprotein with Yx(FWY)xxD motif
MADRPDRKRSLRLLMAPVVVAIAWAAAASGPVETFAIDYPESTPNPTSSPLPTPTPTAAPMSMQVGIRTSATLGTYLADPNGLSLYTLSADPANGSMCIGECTTFWPPLVIAPGGIVASGNGVNGSLGTFTRTDGATQVTHDGRALYLFSGDSASGDTNGEGIVSFGGTWHLARLSISAVPAPACLRIVGGTWNPPGNDNHPPALNHESVRIRNACATTKSLTGWRILDYRAAHVYRFPKGFSIRPGVTVTLFSGQGGRTATHLYWGRRSGEVWGNAFPERAYLRNASGTTVSTFTLYPH